MSQLVAVQSLSFRVASRSSAEHAPSLAVFCNDMPRAVPLQRWDTDNARLAANSAGFGGFLEGERLLINMRQTTRRSDVQQS